MPEHRPQDPLTYSKGVELCCTSQSISLFDAVIIECPPQLLSLSFFMGGGGWLFGIGILCLQTFGTFNIHHECAISGNAAFFGLNYATLAHFFSNP